MTDPFRAVRGRAVSLATFDPCVRCEQGVWPVETVLINKDGLVVAVTHECGHWGVVYGGTGAALSPGDDLDGSRCCVRHRAGVPDWVRVTST